jgi:tetratricopeptide (TPR) repeat protein
MPATEPFHTTAHSILELAPRYELDGHWGEAIRLLKSGIGMANGKTVNQPLKARLQAMLGGLLWKVGDMTTAVTHLEEAKTTATTAGDQNTLADALYHTGEIHYIRHFVMLAGDVHQAMAAHEESLAIREAINDEPGVTHSLSRLGVIFERLGEDELALARHNRALALSEQIGYKRGMTRPLTHIGAFYRRQGDLEKALSYFQQALEINQEIGCQEGMVFGLVNVGSANYQIHQDADETMIAYLRALQIAEKIEFKLAIAHVLFQISVLYESQGLNEIASSYCHKIIQVVKPIEYAIFLNLAMEKLQAFNATDSKKRLIEEH